MNSLLESFAEETIKGLKNISQNRIKEYCFDIDCSELENYLTTDIRKAPKYEKLFEELEAITRQTIYWYEIVSDIDNAIILAAFEKYKEDTFGRPAPALNYYDHNSTRTLYVGKVKACFWGRVIQHLGYHKDCTDHGLQLSHWAKPLSLKLKLHALEINEDMYQLMPSLEVYFAKKLQPLIGKHAQ